MLSCATESCSIQCFFARSNDDLILDENASNFLLLTGLPGRRFLMLSIVIVSPFGSFFLPLGFLFGDLLLRVQSALHQLVVKETVVVHFIKVYFACIFCILSSFKEYFVFHLFWKSLLLLLLCKYLWAPGFKENVFL